MSDWLSMVRRSFASGTVLYSRHAREEMRNEEFGAVLEAEVSESVAAGEVIEEYPDDRPYASRLIFGTTEGGRPIHALCAYDMDEEIAIVITVYQPDPRRWVEFRRRRTS